MYGNFIRELRESAGLSQADLAGIVGTSQPTLSAYEHDRRVPSMDMLNKLASGCGYTLEATAGDHRIALPFPAAGWFPGEEPWAPLPRTDERVSSPKPSDMSPDERARRLEYVLDLGDALRASKAMA